MPQPVGASEDYFAVFGLEVKFSLDQQLLQQRFYELSRMLHPDRFSKASAGFQELSLLRMSWINQAYTCLRNPTRFRDYLLKLEKISTRSQNTIPAELAEAWFELQEASAERPVESEEVQAQVKDFESQLTQARSEVQVEVRRLETAYDATQTRVHLESLSNWTQRDQYLQSLEKTVRALKR